MLFDFIVMRVVAPFVRVSLKVVGCLVSKLKNLRNRPKRN